MGFPGAVAGLHLSGVGLITGPQESGRVNYGTAVNAVAASRQKLAKLKK